MDITRSKHSIDQWYQEIATQLVTAFKPPPSLYAGSVQIWPGGGTLLGADGGQFLFGPTARAEP
jgi:hypothetical protein